MTLYLSTATTQPKSPITAISGVSGFTPYHRIYDYLYAVDTTQYTSPINQALGWGYSRVEHNPARPNVPTIPTWMSPEYPFVSPSEDIQGYVTDILLSFDDPLENIEVPIKLSRITKHGDRLYSVRFTDVNDKVVFDSSAYNYTRDSIELTGNNYIAKATNQSGDCVYKHKYWGAYYDLLYWETELVTLKMIIRITNIKQFTLYPDSGELDTRALYQYPKRIRSITIINENRWPPERDLLPPYMIPKYGDMYYITEDSVELWEGYNMQFSWSDNSDIRNSHIITLSAVKGAGEGIAKLECPEDEPNRLITTINGVEATEDGAFFVTSDACHTVRGTNKIELGNDCKPCCECEDMTKVGKLLNQIEDEYYCIGGKYQVAVENYKNEIVDLENKIEKDKLAKTSIEYDVVEGNRLFLRFRFIFRNRLSECIHNLRISFYKPNMTIWNATQSVPDTKDYDDCYVVDESPVLITNPSQVKWDGRIGPGQQVYLKGYWKLDTSVSPPYSNYITQILYDTETLTDVQANISHLQHFSFPMTGHTIKNAYEDFTATSGTNTYLTQAQLEELEEEIRLICMNKHLDDEEIRNSHPSSDVIGKHVETPRKTRQRPNDSTNL